MKNANRRLQAVAMIMIGLLFLLLVGLGPLSARAASTTVLITAVYHDPYLTGEPEEAFHLTNVGASAVDLTSWTVTDGEGTVTLTGSLASGDSLWIAKEADDFEAEFGFKLDFEYGADTDPTVPDLSRSGTLTLANDGDELILKDNTNAIVDSVVYESGSTAGTDWSGGGIDPYNQGYFGLEGQVLYRKLDQATGLPVSDTDAAADWAQVTDDDINGKKVMYPGWDLERYFFTTTFTETATITYTVASDNIYETVLAEINKATESIYYEGYAFKNAHLADAIVARMTANPDMTVTVLLEGEPVGGITDQEKWICQQIENAGGSVHFMYTDDATDVHDRYNYQHGKWMVIDEEVLPTGSENLNYSSMPANDKTDGTYGNRGVRLITDAPGAVAHALDVFRRDVDPDNQKDLFRWTAGDPTYGAPPGGFTPDYSSGGTAYTVQFPTPLTVSGTFFFEMVQSPDNSLRDTDGLLGMVARAGSGDTVLVEQLYERTFWGPTSSNPTDDPNPRLEAYIAAARRGARVRILLDSFYDDPGDVRGNTATCNYVNGIAASESLDLACLLGNPAGSGIHNKMVLVLDGGQGYAHTGSINGSENSSKNNREMAVQVKSTEAYTYLVGMFWQDWVDSGGSSCSTICSPGNGWAVDMCDTDPNITTPMDVVLDGVLQGQAALVRIYHQSQSYPGSPQVAVIYASGFVRLKQNADPSPPIPFGSSFVLGPAYQSSLSPYYHNPQLDRLEIDTTWLPNAPLRMRAEGTNHDFDIAYEMVLPPARDRQARLHVIQAYTATASIDIDLTQRAESQGFKLVQVSSMFINEGGTCDGSHTDCHDSNGTRFIGSDLVRHQVAFTDVVPSSFVFSPALPLGSTWLDALHTDDESWQGNTPNVRIALDALPTDHTVTAQGWISATTDPNNDNVGLWLHDDNPASQSWTAGQSDQVGYWLLAQDDPPEPWADLGLRAGLTITDFESSHNCFFVKDSGQPTSGTVSAIASYSDTALELEYDLGSENGNWAQIRCNFDPPLDLSAHDHLRFDWRGDPDAANSLGVGLINPGDGQDYIFARGYHHATHRYWWGQLVIPFSFLSPWTEGTSFDPSQVSAFFVYVVKDSADDVGGAGSIAIDNLSAYNVISRTVPTTFETVSTNNAASTAAANWLATQQQPTGLLKSWEEEGPCLAHTYDQALALIVFANEGMWDQANALVDALVTIQNRDGSWFQTHKCDTSPPQATTNNKWEGDIAWAVYALSRYLALSGTAPEAGAAMCKGTTWLAGRVDPSNGCVVDDKDGTEISTEGTIDVWWALQAAGPNFVDEAELVKNCLLTYRWDEEMGRFKGGRDVWQPYLDNQTWGAAFLKAIDEEEKALRASSYAREVLRLPAQGGQLFGFDGNAGPWSVWNEGAGQYIALGGDGADDLLLELLAQQREDGAVPGSPDEFGGGGVWTPRWHGVAPTAWLYNALNSEPFYPGAARQCSYIYVPIVLKNYAP